MLLFFQASLSFSCVTVSVSLSACTVCLHHCPFNCLFGCLSVCLSVCLSSSFVHLSTCQFHLAILYHQNSSFHHLSSHQRFQTCSRSFFLFLFFFLAFSRVHNSACICIQGIQNPLLSNTFARFPFLSFYHFFHVLFLVFQLLLFVVNSSTRGLVKYLKKNFFALKHCDKFVKEF